MTELRDYQRHAINALYAFFDRDDGGNPLLVMPTGSGKSHVVAGFLHEVLQTWPDQRVLVATHVRELIEQNHAKLLQHWPDAPAGIFSAGLGRYDVLSPITFVGIQSVHRKAAAFGRVDLVLVDEAHLVPKDGQGMYRTFLDALRTRNQALRVIGLTATPFRLQGGMLHRGDGRIFTDIAYDVDLLRLVDQGYLAPLTAKRTRAQMDVSGVHVRAGEFVTKELEAAALRRPDAVREACREIVDRGQDRRSWLVFCCGVAHAEAVMAELNLFVSAGLVTGATPKEERDDLIARFRAGSLRALVNVNVLTTGFDAPQTDLLAVLRPTASPVLYVQMMGRGMRPAPGKKDCLVLDFGGNVMRHGPINHVRPVNTGKAEGPPPAKSCPQCDSLVATGTRECPDCGYAWPERRVTHDRGAGEIDPLAREPFERFEVRGVGYALHEKPGKPNSIRVAYVCGLTTFSEWVCLEHDGWPGRRARSWWRERGGGTEPPHTAAAALEQINAGLVRLREPAAVRVRLGGKFPEVVGYEWRREAAAAGG